MKYKNLIIKIKQKDIITFQKYLFSLNYAWIDNTYSKARNAQGIRSKQIKTFKSTPNDELIYICIGKSCDIFEVDFEGCKTKADFDLFKIKTYEQISRKIKYNEIIKNTRT